MDAVEKRIIEIIDRHQEEIIALGRDIFEHAELGFKEHRTAQKAAELMKKHGLEVETGLAVTGVKGSVRMSAGPSVAVIGEMDALPIPDHPSANPETGAAHCCGHNAQMAGMLGAVIALTDPEIKSQMDGRLVFMAVPSEEYVELEFKNGLMEKGVIEFGGGKSELIRLGAFDDVDIALGHHTKVDRGVMLYNSSMNGFVNKQVRYFGRAVHASTEPENGVDALKAMALMMHALELQRENFRDEDHVRVHGFVSRGGTAPNIVADDVRLEYSIRAAGSEALLRASELFDRAARAGAVGTGCACEIKTVPGYLPLIPARDTRVTERAIELASGGRYPVEYEREDTHLTASSDYGDLSSVMPVLQFYTGGYTGALHSTAVRLTDEYLAYVVTAKVFALEAFALLKNGGEKALEIKRSFVPAMSREQYISRIRAMKKTEKIQGEGIVI